MMKDSWKAWFRRGRNDHEAGSSTGGSRGRHSVSRSPLQHRSSFFFGPPPRLRSERCVYLILEAVCTLAKEGMPFLWPHVHLPAAWHLNGARVLVSAIPTSGLRAAVRSVVAGPSSRQFSEIRLPPCDIHFRYHCVQALAKAYVENITITDETYWRIEKEMGSLLALYSKERCAQFVYVDGWDGLGASSVLRAIVKSLASKEKMWNVKQIVYAEPVLIHVDCSMWQSIRVVQRAVAEQLNLPRRVMEKFDQQDDEEDFDGVDPGSRDAIEHVEKEIRMEVENRGFLLVLHNGGNKEINLGKLGLSTKKFHLCTVFWTFRGRFRVDPKMIHKVVWKPVEEEYFTAGATRNYFDNQYYYHFQSDDSDNTDFLLRAEAEEVAQKHAIDPAIVFECFRYMLDRNHMSLHNIDHDWALHACNYWICDGIIPRAHEAWQLGEALHRDMEFFIDYLSSHELSRQGCTEVDGRDLHLHHMRMSDEHRPYFISSETCGFILNRAGIVPDNKFQHSEKIRVLKLSGCKFKFASPPFLCCHSLRFLCLDRCRDMVSSTDAEEEEILASWPCFQGLWVLDLRYTHWDEILSSHMLDIMTQLRELNVMGARNLDMSCLHGRLSNIHKLRLTKSTCCNSEESGDHNLFLEMGKMERFEFSENRTTQGMRSLSGAASLKTVTVGGCVGLEHISFKGCQELKDLFFAGLLANLEELDLSNTAIKFLDLGKLEDGHLKRLILLGCEKLRAILWPPKAKRAQYLEVLRIDNTLSTSSGQANLEEKIKEDRPSSIGSSSSSAGGKELVGSGQSASSFDFNWYISMSDARLLRSIVPFEQYLKGKCVYIEMDSYHASRVVSGGIQQQGSNGIRNQTGNYSSYAKDAVVEGHLQVVASNEGVITLWACPPAPTLTANDCYFHIQDEGEMYSDEDKMWGRYIWDRSKEIFTVSPPALICNVTNVFHVHDSLSVKIGFPFEPDFDWNCLEWCKVERCPKLRHVFTVHLSTHKNMFRRLRTIWVSQLPKARYAWSWSSEYLYGTESFCCLGFLHIDCCPKLKIVLCFCYAMNALPCLETLEIVCCGDVIEVFHPWDSSHLPIFPRLRHIHLHKLPKMRNISGVMTFAPVLETIKIRGCRSLRRLPAVMGGNRQLPKVDCEKEWWENLEWDGMWVGFLKMYTQNVGWGSRHVEIANHHPSLYQQRHPLN